MTIKWVKVDPLVMNGEAFCYGSRLTVRQVLEARANGYTVVDLLKDNPELRLVGIAEAYAYAAAHREQYAEYFEADGTLAGPASPRTRPRPSRSASGSRRGRQGAGTRLTLANARPGALDGAACRSSVAALDAHRLAGPDAPGVGATVDAVTLSEERLTPWRGARDTLPGERLTIRWRQRPATGAGQDRALGGPIGVAANSESGDRISAR